MLKKLTKNIMRMILQRSALWHTPYRESGDKVAIKGLVAGDVCVFSR